MSERKIEALWDCSYCDTKGIGGLTKHCPNCGQPQDENTEFYLGKKLKYLSAKEGKEYGKGADWICSYCESLNRYNNNICSNCGASRDENKGDYFHKQKKSTDSELSQIMEKSSDTYSQSERRLPERFVEYTTVGDLLGDPFKARSKSRKKTILIIIAVVLATALLIGGGILLFSPKTQKAEIINKSWEREITVQEYKTLQESDWSVPAGGRVYREAREIHHYDEVFDHYETQTEQKSRQVFDGYDTDIDRINNGDGTFSERTRQTPRYRTEYYTETKQVPVYKDVPVYRTKYYYEIERWVYGRSVTTTGSANEPYWGEVILAEKEREGARTEKYLLIIQGEKKEYKPKVEYSLWSNKNIGDTVEITTRAGKIVSYE